jgi:hypothetical protein
MFVDDLTKEQCERLRDIIGNGIRPIKGAKKLFPDCPKDYVLATRDIRAYCWNKIISLDKDLLWETRKNYATICAVIWVNLPVWARSIPDDIFNM